MRRQSNEDGGRLFVRLLPGAPSKEALYMLPIAGRITEAMQLRYLHIQVYDLPHTWRIDGRTLDNAVIWLPDDGELELSADDAAPIRASAGDLLFLAPGTKLACRARTATLRIVSLNFEAAAFAGRWPASLRFPLRYAGDTAPLAAVLRGMLADDAADGDAGRPLLLQAGLLRLLGLMASGTAAAREALADGGGDARVREAIARMASRPDAFPAAAELADAAGTSESHLRKLFLRETGLPPLQYAHRLKASLAMRRLAGGDERVSEIAYSLGYDDPNYFARMFKKCSGMTPQEYRRKHRDWMAAEE